MLQLEGRFLAKKKGACCKAPGPAGISTSFALLFSPPRPRSLVRGKAKKKSKECSERHRAKSGKMVAGADGDFCAGGGGGG